MTKRGGSKSAKGGVFLALFGLPFLLGGCATGFLAVRMIVQYRAAQSWAEVPAWIQTVELDSSSSDDGTTYRVECTYRYIFNGREYTGGRVGLATMSDNIGSWHADMHRRLKAAYQRERSVPCFVNPERPDEALLDRELRFGLLAFLLLFAAIFGGVGTLLIVGAVYGTRHVRREQKLQAAHPDEPWLHHEAWTSRVVRPDLGTKAVAAWIFALFWNGVSAPALVFLPREIMEKHNYLALLGLIFPLVGAGLLVYAIRATIQRRKFGASRLELETLPGIIGGPLRGTLVLAGETAWMQEVHARLRCIHSRRVRRGKGRSTEETTLWWYSRTLQPPPATFGQAEVRLPIAFQVPYDCRPSDNSDPNDGIKWQLEVRAAVPGVDLALDFEVPVFRTSESDPSIGESEERLAAEAAAIQDDEPPEGTNIRVIPAAGGETRLVIACWPGMRVFGLLLFFVLLFTGSCVFFMYRLSEGDWFFALFLLVFGLIALLLWWAMGSCLGSWRLALRPDELEIRRSLGLLSRTRRVPVDEVRDVSYKQCASSGDRRWYRVKLRVKGGKKVRAAEMIEGDIAARWLVQRVEEHVTASGMIGAGVGEARKAAETGSL